MPDQDFMLHALRLAHDAMPRTSPNPAVGCVLVRDGVVVGEGATQPAGQNHAEIEALAIAGDRARGATAFVTLEPCAHHGRTPPCSQALISAGISRVVAAAPDPNPEVNGRGLRQLQEAGIEVATGEMEAEARALNRGFFSRMVRGRPWLTVKTALSLDGRSATATGDSQWISGEASRADVHRMRRRTDAILIGAGTARADNPRLTARNAGQADYCPWRVVVSSSGALPAGLNLIEDGFADKTIILSRVRRQAAADPIADSGVQWVKCDGLADGRVDLTDGLKRLLAFGINTVLCEPGPALAAGLWATALADELICFRAPIILGGDGQAGWNSLGVERLSQAAALQRVAIGPCGEDVREHYLSPAGADLVEPKALTRLLEIMGDLKPPTGE